MSIQQQFFNFAKQAFYENDKRDQALTYLDVCESIMLPDDRELAEQIQTLRTNISLADDYDKGFFG